MPQRIFCSECGHCLYEGEILKSPQDVLKKYDGRCPSCNKRLSFSPGGVLVSPIEKEDNSSK